MGWLRKARGAVLVAGAVLATAGAIIAPIATGGGGGGGCTTTLSSGSVSSALSSATAGDTICLNAGSYTYASGTISKSAMTTVQATAGAAGRDSVTITGNPDLLASHNLTFKDLTFAGLNIGTSSNGGAIATNLQFLNIHYSNCFHYYQGTSGIANVTMDGGLADMSAAGTGTTSPCGDDGRFRLIGFNDAGFGTSLVNFTIKNIAFSGTAHCTDGIEMTGGQTGVTIGPGNEFKNILEGSCSTHVDSIQIFGGGLYSTITGNYFHDNDDSLAFFNSAHHVTITNNVIYMTRSYPAIWCGWCEDMTIMHNALNQDIYFKDYTPGTTDHDPQHSSGIVEDNVLSGDSSVFKDNIDQSDPALMSITSDYNLQPTAAIGLNGNGPHDVYSNSPVFVGGTIPTTWAGWALSCAGSPGCGAAHDGSNMGITPP